MAYITENIRDGIAMRQELRVDIAAKQDELRNVERELKQAVLDAGWVDALNINWGILNRHLNRMK